MSAAQRSGPVGVALIGAGVISAQYLKTLSTFPDVRLLGIADLDAARAREAAEPYGIPVAGGVDEVLAVPEVEVVVNLTVPAAHTAVARQVLAAGKHVYGEKPLALDAEDGAKLLAEAAQAGLRVGSAPDTFLGAGLQSAARAIRSGAIGEPLSATTAVTNAGPERWHHSPEFLFAAGAGPLFDLGPYYLTALAALFGSPVTRVAATARRARAERVIGSGPRAGSTFPVEVPTDVTALLEFAGGQGASSRFSFDAPVKRTLIEITGTEAELRVPDPNFFDGVLLRRAVGETEWTELPVTGPTSGRGLGVLDLARALRAGVPARASGELALHVVDAMCAIDRSAAEGTFQQVASTCPTPEPLPEEWDPEAATLA
ncbi:Gfo/Idh/MocA family protein [Phaeacidiphilus oryzae]|uniref:Gfo/Idh/MocA family protein n=1 Tax=Phaeacidiphilus oryzae TaxID=348818 RepID=UPI00056A6DDF|nr:Gfo/Idh/MocA family oxidoreductase [Phaeacidiphilus oryzae]